MPTSAVLQNPQSAAADSGMPESAVLQPPTQPMEGVTDHSVPPEMYKIQEEPEHFSTDSAADSESDSSNQPWVYPSTDIREKRKRERRLARKALQAKATDSGAAAGAMVPPTKPLLKSDVSRNSRTYIWNSSNKKSQVLKTSLLQKKCRSMGSTFTSKSSPAMRPKTVGSRLGRCPG